MRVIIIMSSTVTQYVTEGVEWFGTLTSDEKAMYASGLAAGIALLWYIFATYVRPLFPILEPPSHQMDESKVVTVEEDEDFLVAPNCTVLQRHAAKRWLVGHEQQSAVRTWWMLTIRGSVDVCSKLRP